MNAAARRFWNNASWLFKIRSLTQSAAVIAVLGGSVANLHADNTITDGTSFDTAILNMRSGTDTISSVTTSFSLSSLPASLDPSIGVNSGSFDGFTGGEIINGDTSAYIIRSSIPLNQTYSLSITDLNFIDTSGNNARGILKVGNGTLALTGDSTFNASTLTTAIQIFGGTLSVASDSNLGNSGNNVDLQNGTTLAITGATTLNAARTITLTGSCTINTVADVICDSTITGGGSVLTSSGAGVLALTGLNNTVDVTVVDTGSLFVTGKLTSAVNVNPGAILGGDGNGVTTGLVNGLIDSSGTVDPGASPNTVGTLTVAGAFTSENGSTLHIDTNGTSNDLLVADSVILGDATVEVHGLPGSSALVAGQQYVFLHSNNPVVGQFVGVTDDLPMINVLLGYTANDVYFYFVSSGMNFASVAITPNELSVAKYLDQTAPTATGDYLTVINNLNILNTQQLQGAYIQLGGESAGTTAQTSINTTTLSLQQVGNHLSALAMSGSAGGFGGTNMMAQVSPTSSTSASPNNIQLVSHSDFSTTETKKAEASALYCDACDNEKLWNGWSTGYGLGGSAQGGGGVSGARYGVGGFVAGVDRWIDESTLVGVFGGYLGSSFTTGTPNANVRDNAGQGGLYAMRRGDVLYVSGLIGGQSDQYTSHRNINFAAINRTATGNYDGWQGFGYSELGANLTANKLTLQPYGALQYIHLRQNSLSETGAGSLNLASGGMDTDSLRSFLGTRFRYDNQGENNLRRFIPELQASWLHEYIDASTALNARFGAVGGNGFTTTGLNVGRDWALLGAGVTYVVTDNVRLAANYYTQTNDRQTYHVGAGGLSIQW